MCFGRCEISMLKIKKLSKAFRVIIVVEILMVLLQLFFCFYEKYETDFQKNQIISDNAQLTILNDSNGGISWQNVNADKLSYDTKIFHTENLKLNPGAYKVKIEYTSSVFDSTRKNFDKKVGTLKITSKNHTTSINCAEMYLTEGREFMETKFQVTSPIAVEDISLELYQAGETQKLTVNKISVEEIVVFRFAKLLITVIIIALLNLIFYYLIENKEFKYKRELGVLTLICAVASLPFLTNILADGHDITFHINRIICLADEISQGNPFPTIYTTALNGYGYANPLFYPQTFLYLPAILYCLGFSGTFAYHTYVILISTATCLITYYSAKKMFNSVNAALFASALYTLSTFRFTNVLVRCSLGEYTALTFLPLLLLGVYNIYNSDSKEKIGFSKYLPIIIGFTGIINSHILSFAISVMILAVFCIISYKKTFTKNVILAFIKSAVSTFLVNMGFLVPMLNSMSMNLNVSDVENYIQKHGTYLWQIFNPVVTGNQGGSAHISYKDMPLTIGFALIMGLILHVVCLVYGKRKTEGIQFSYEEPMLKKAGVFFWLCLITVVLSLECIPYDNLDVLPKGIYSLLTVYQFPWRWLTFATLFGVFCTVATVLSLKNHKFRIIIAMAIMVTMILNIGQFYSDQMQTTNFSALPNNSYTYNSYIGMGEYLPKDTVRSELNYRDLLYDGAKLEIEDYSYQKGETTLKVNNLTQKEAYIDIPLLRYDNYVAFDKKTGEEISIYTGVNNRVGLTIPAGYSGEICVKYHFRIIWKIAVAVSILSTLMLVAIYVLKRKDIEFSISNIKTSCSKER